MAPVCMFHHDILALQRNELLESVVAGVFDTVPPSLRPDSKDITAAVKPGAGADFQNPVAGAQASRAEMTRA
ncbi:hypothetical protein VXQ18_03725 [Brucella abortus]|nr:hypothetical protein [Brucella abortus]